ncbi:MAG: phage holin family protein [Chitinophagaceae bacterium]|nr:phage holin family protein [Chitinophagaceae bacterium]
MEKAFAQVEELAETVKEYVNTRIEAAKLNTAEKKLGYYCYLVIAGLIVAAIFMFFLVFGFIVLALGLGDWLGKPWAGFLIVAFLFLLVAIIIWFARVKIIQLPVMNALIKLFF